MSSEAGSTSYHPAMDGVANLLFNAGRNLDLVHQQLEREFRQAYPDHANPMKIVERVKKMEEDVASLTEQCRELLAEKQDLIDKAWMTLVTQKSSLQRLLASSGLPLLSESDEMLYTDLEKIMDEWKTNLGMKKEEGGNGHSEINGLFLSNLV